jgi:hypothetical protein
MSGTTTGFPKQSPECEVVVCSQATNIFASGTQLFRNARWTA